MPWLDEIHAATGSTHLNVHLAALPIGGKAVLDWEALKAQLYQQIGQLKVELDWLKKKVGLFG